MLIMVTSLASAVTAPSTAVATPPAIKSNSRTAIVNISTINISISNTTLKTIVSSLTSTPLIVTSVSATLPTVEVPL